MALAKPAPRARVLLGLRPVPAAGEEAGFEPGNFWQLPDTDAMMERKIQTALELNCSTSGALTHIGLID